MNHNAEIQELKESIAMLAVGIEYLKQEISTLTLELHNIKSDLRRKETEWKS